MAEFEKTFVDGCAIFFRNSKFTSLADNLMEFSSMAIKKTEIHADGESFSRLMSKDNIAVSVLLEVRDKPATPGQVGGHTRPQLLVVNCHIHWNPAFSDVKLVQTQMMLEELSKGGGGVPMVVCGDFNSMPDSAVYQLLAEGEVSGEHADMQQFRYGSYTNDGFRHSLPLNSAYCEVLGAEPSFTNYTADFVGALDYIFYTRDTLICNGVLEPPPLAVVRKNTALPNPAFPSDHVSLLVELELRPHRVNVPRPFNNQ
jgi:CCR4-NOT transcription complex subunit 6